MKKQYMKLNHPISGHIFLYPSSSRTTDLHKHSSIMKISRRRQMISINKISSIRLWTKTFSEASSRKPFSTKSMFSIFPSPESPFESLGTFSFSSKSSFTDQHGEQRKTMSYKLRWCDIFCFKKNVSAKTIIGMGPFFIIGMWLCIVLKPIIHSQDGAFFY